ncbi:MAG TPA: Gfo/Idh/MocA family oxidoreductase [Candidatus Binatia bacterium]|jgi:predicted dehydrogenase
MNVVVVGYGSIGSRHARLLSELGCDVSIVSAREIEEWRRYKDIDSALRDCRPDYVIVANSTSEHYPAVAQLAGLGFAGIVLVEKPLFHTRLQLPPNNFRHFFVAYNLRFHPQLQRLRKLLRGEGIVCASIYAGQYLPQWRPNSDYRLGYSAKKAGGGGALRDLSHELDYATWLLGDWRKVAALGGHLSRLEIDSDDVFSLMIVTERCPVVNIHVNYLDRSHRREILVITDTHTIKADLVRGVMEVDGVSEEFHTDRDYTYRLQHQAAIDRRLDTLCSVSEGLEVLRLIEGAEQAVVQSEWVAR